MHLLRGAIAPERAGRDIDPVAEFVNPTPLIEERIAAEVGSLREVLT
jgi:hypothetical protein